MLRREVGDSAFFSGVREYYSTFRDTTALSSDFAAVIERFAGRPLDWFFKQWLLQPGYPRLDVTWSYEAGELSLTVKQTQPAKWGFYRLSLPVAVETEDGGKDQFNIPLEARAENQIRQPLAARPTRLVLDPEGVLLAETEARPR
jgi:aminopeptidase N